MTKTHRVAYIMSRFPKLSETFILREMCALEELGWQIELYPLIVQSESVVHDDAQAWIQRAHKPNIGEVLAENLKFFVSHPITLMSVFIKVFAGNINSQKFLIRAIILWPKAVWMAGQMKKQDINHIHAHYATHPALVAWIVKELVNIPYSVTVHAHDIFVDKTMLFQKLENAKHVVAISQYNREYLVDLFGSWIDKKIQVIHCGVSPDLYISNNGSHSLTNDIFEILSIGSLQPYKGFVFLIDACRILHRQGFQFKCKIIGDGELHGLLLNKIKDCNLQNHVELLGGKSQGDVINFLKSADCYVQPSVVTGTGKMEGIPVSLMEAMACELPVIATDISGVPELVSPGETGVLVQPENSQALADAIREVRSNPAVAVQYARAGKEFVSRKFNLQLNTSLLSNLFQFGDIRDVA